MRLELRDPVTAFVGLGANLGDPRSAVLLALEKLGQLPDTRLVARSRLYLTAPVDARGPDFVNAVARLSTRLNAPQLWAWLWRMESDAGRVRPHVNAPRTLDLDLLLYGDAVIQSPALTVPHPRMTQRAFVLRPLADVSPERVSPVSLQAVAGQKLIVLADA
jgi:2-amino-4-hydroxy-6-hydroxymethyldihydropteridine diphosphokinase